VGLLTNHYLLNEILFDNGSWLIDVNSSDVFPDTNHYLLIEILFDNSSWLNDVNSSDVFSEDQLINNFPFSKRIQLRRQRESHVLRGKSFMQEWVEQLGQPRAVNILLAGLGWRAWDFFYRRDDDGFLNLLERIGIKLAQISFFVFMKRPCINVRHSTTAHCTLTYFPPLYVSGHQQYQQPTWLHFLFLPSMQPKQPAYCSH